MWWSPILLEEYLTPYHDQDVVTHSSGRMHMYPMILLSKTNGMIIYLLPNELHCTFTENLLWKLVTLVLKDFFDNVCDFCELFILS